MARSFSKSEDRQAPERALLVQCCHRLQFLFIWDRLTSRYPDWTLDVLWSDDADWEIPQASSGRFYQRKAPPDTSAYDRVIFPLLNRGHHRMKSFGRGSAAKLWKCDYEGTLAPLDPRDRIRSHFRPPAPPKDFFDFHNRSARVRFSGPRILVQDRYLRRQISHHWKRYLPDSAVITVRESSPAVGESLRETFDGAVIFFDSRSDLKTALLAMLSKIPQILLVDETGLCHPLCRKGVAGYFLKRILLGGPRSLASSRILFVQTESPIYVVHAVGKLLREPLYPGAEITLICRQSDLSAFQEQLAGCRLVAVDGLISAWKARRIAESIRPDLGCVVFSGRPVFLRYKLLLLSLNFRRLLAFNAALESYFLKPSTAPRVFRSEPLLFDSTPAEKVLLLQTDNAERMRKAVLRLKDPNVTGASEIVLFCSEENRGLVRSLPGVTDVVTYRRGSPVKNFKTFLELRRTRFDVIAAVFSGRPTFRRSKTLFFLLRGQKLVLNKRTDCYYLGLRTIRNLFRREESPIGTHRTLLVQSEDDDTTLRAIETLKRPNLPPLGELYVFCRADKQSVFEGHPSVHGTIPYAKSGPLEAFRQLRRFRRLGLDAAAIILSGRPIYRLHKLMFFFIPARHRLVINENLDCFYLTWRNPYRLIRLHLANRQPFTKVLVRQGLKAILFLPRFLYLLAWTAAMKARRPRTGS